MPLARLKPATPGSHGKCLGQIFLLVDLGDFFFRFRVVGAGKKAPKIQLFLNISRTNSKTSKVNQQSALNLEIFHSFPKNLHRTLTFNPLVPTVSYMIH